MCSHCNILCKFAFKQTLVIELLANIPEFGRQTSHFVLQGHLHVSFSFWALCVLFYSSYGFEEKTLSSRCFVRPIATTATFGFSFLSVQFMVLTVLGALARRWQPCLVIASRGHIGFQHQTELAWKTHLLPLLLSFQNAIRFVLRLLEKSHAILLVKLDF